MENKILTADEFLQDLQSEYEKTGEYKMYFAIDIPNKLREFAKLHVEAALKAASEKADGIDGDNFYIPNTAIDKESILNAYPLTNIK